MNYGSFIKYKLLRQKLNQQKIQQRRKHKQKLEKILNLFNNIQVISLGSMCFVKLFLDKIGLKQETHFFDWIGSSLWSISLALENNFEELLDRNQLSYMHILNKEDEYVWTHAKYYLRFKHDFKQTYKKQTNDIKENEWNDFKNKYERRYLRLFSTLQNNNNLIFIRLEEIKENRINYPQYDIHKIHNDIEETINISNWLKTYNPNLKFKIIFIERYTFGNPQICENEPNILIIRKLSPNGDLNYRENTIFDIFYENYNFLTYHIQNINA